MAPIDLNRNKTRDSLSETPTARWRWCRGKQRIPNKAEFEANRPDCITVHRIGHVELTRVEVTSLTSVSRAPAVSLVSCVETRCHSYLMCIMLNRRYLWSV